MLIEFCKILGNKNDQKYTTKVEAPLAAASGDS